jgi:hypothetical protein
LEAAPPTAPPSLTILQALVNLLNKRPSIQSDFAEMDGYALLQRIYTSMAGLNLYQSRSAAAPTSATYFASIQTDLFVILLNGCFRQAVVCTNRYLDFI